MTSGSGIVHSEGPTASFVEKGGRLELLQVWINLPASDKSLTASFRNYPGSGFPLIEEEQFRLKVVIVILGIKDPR